MRGRFITIEGIEGVGKSTNIEFVTRYLERAGKDVMVTREPGGTPVGEAIRALVLDRGHDGMAADTELLLIFAARAEHLAQIIQPALHAGTWVVCDRFTDATYAYQGGGRGIPTARIAVIEQWVQGQLRPDLTLILDASVEAALERANARGRPDRFEAEEQAFFHRVSETYLRRAEADPERYRLIDAEQALAAVQADIATVLDRFLGEHAE